MLEFLGIIKSNNFRIICSKEEKKLSFLKYLFGLMKNIFTKLIEKLIII
jgi:hypothetical protein